MSGDMKAREGASVLRPILHRPFIFVMTSAAMFALLFIVIINIEPLFTAQTMLVLPESSSTDLVQRSSNPNVAQSDPFLVKSYGDIAKSDQLCLDVIRALDLTAIPEFHPKSSLLVPFKTLLSHLVVRKKRSFDEADRQAAAQDEALHLYKKNMTVVNDGHSLTLLLSFQAEDPRLAALIVNQHATSFINAQVRHRSREAEKKTAWLKKQLDAAAKDARDAQVTLQSSMPDTGRGFNPAEHAAELKARQAVASAKQSVYDALLSRFMVLDAEQSYVEPDIRIASTAPVPFLPSYPNVPLFIGAAFILAIIAGALSAAAVEMMWQPVDPVRILRTSGHNTFGLVRIPSLLDRLRPYNSQRMKRMRFWEQIRSLRCDLSSSSSSCSVVVLTSVDSKSGTTTLAASLAKASAASGARTLLIDLNFRKPGSLAKLKIEPNNGSDLIAAIEDRTALPRAMKKFQGSETLSVLTCDARSARRVKLDLLASAKLDSLFEDLRTQFSFIVVDTPPVGLVSDALPCMRRADKILLVTTKTEAIAGRLQETAAELARMSFIVDSVIVTRLGGNDDPNAERMKSLLVADELADGKSSAAWRKLFKGKWSKPWAQLAEGKRLVEASEI